MLALTRFRVSPAEADSFAPAIGSVAELLRQREGCVDCSIGRAMDDPTLWVLSSRWVDVRSYRRSLSAFDIRVAMAEVMHRMLDEPGAYELVEESP